MRAGAWAGLVLLFAAGCGADEPADTPPAAALPPPALPDVSHLELPAIEAIQHAHGIAKNVGDAESWTFYGRTLFAHDLNVAAEEACLFATKAPGAVPFEAWYFAGLGAALASHERAVGHLRHAIAMNPSYAPARLRLAILLEQMGDLDGARDAYADVLDLTPSSHALLGLARIAVEDGNDREALLLLGDARKIDPDHTEVLALISQVLTRSGDDEGARRAAELVDPAHRPTAFSDPVLRDALLLCNSHYGLVRGMHAQQDLGDLAGALALAKRCVLLYPDVFESRTQYADLLRLAGRFDEAAGQYRAALALEPEHAVAKSLLGLTLADLGRPDDGERIMREAVLDAPGRVEPRYNLAYFLAAGREAEAKEILVPLVRDAPNHTESRMLLAGVCLTLGDRERTLEELRTVLRQKPSHALARQKLAELTR